jgi:hypothetical protein
VRGERPKETNMKDPASNPGIMLARASEAKTVSDVKNAPHRSGEKRSSPAPPAASGSASPRPSPRPA